MLYKNLHYYFPHKLTAGKKFQRTRTAIKGVDIKDDCVAKQFNDVSPKDPLFIEKQYVEISSWPVLEDIYERDNTGFFDSDSKAGVGTRPDSNQTSDSKAGCDSGHVQNHNMRKPQLTINDIPYSAQYNDNPTCYTLFQVALRQNIHIGQRKLFLTEVQHLAAKLDSYDEAAIVIYAGAAPSNKAWLMHQLFPNVKFIFVDPNEFFIYIGKYDVPHYTVADTNLVCYLSYSDSNQYGSANPEWKRKHIQYYNHETGKVDFILDKEYGRSLSVQEYKNVNKQVYGNRVGKFWRENKEQEHTVISGNATQASFDFVFNSDYTFYLCEEYFTDETAAKISAAISKANFAGKVLFWSDIRSNLNTNEHPADLDIIWNNAITYSWLRIIKPTFAMVKFRPPFFESGEINYSAFQNDFDLAKQHGLDFIESTKTHLGIHFFKGVIWIQPWCGGKSVETRLWIDKDDIVSNNIVFYDLKTYEDKFFCYNIIDRYALLHENDNANKLIGFDHCNDCAIENSIWKLIKSKRKDLNIAEWIHKTTELLRVQILDRKRQYGHGHLFPDLTTDLNKWR